MGAIAGLLAACSSTKPAPVMIEAPVMSAYYSDWDRAVRADVDMQNMYTGTPSKIEKPIDMYMAMALALKYNYTRRLASYQENLIKSNITPSAMPTMAENLGYENATNSPAIPSDLKVSWNLLDLSALYYQNGLGSPEIAAEEQSRKVVNNIMFEARTLYWKALAAQRLIPVIDDMNEYLVRVVDEINAYNNEAAREGVAPSTGTLLKKRKYLESIKELAALRRKFDTAQAEFAGLLGLYPSTEIKLAGSEYGNFAVPSMRVKMQQLEWLALTNRPELRAFDNGTSKEELELVVKEFDDVDNSDYRQNANYYNSKWSKTSHDLSMSVFEDIRYQGTDTYNTLARQRMTNIILNQVYLSWRIDDAAVDQNHLVALVRFIERRQGDGGAYGLEQAALANHSLAPCLPVGGHCAIGNWQVFDWHVGHKLHDGLDDARALCDVVEAEREVCQLKHLSAVYRLHPFAKLPQLACAIYPSDKCSHRAASDRGDTVALPLYLLNGSDVCQSPGTAARQHQCNILSLQAFTIAAAKHL